MDKNFSNLMATLKDSIKTWEYFVDWNKVFENKARMEITLNKLNYLLGKDDLQAEFDRLFRQEPDIIRAIPVLVATREDQLEIFDYEDRSSEFFDFGELITYSEDTSKKCYEFIEKSGLHRLFKEDGVKNLVDYVFGVEVGLDSNGRKNRGGKIMENIVEKYLKEFCATGGCEYLAQATPTMIQTRWGIVVEIDKSERSFDFAVWKPGNDEGKLTLVETNFYNGGGSKLKAVCGEFRSLYDELKRQDIDFVWITDGKGWLTSRNSLEETYNHNDYVFNLADMENGVLGYIF